MYIFKSNLRCDDFLSRAPRYARRYLDELKTEYDRLTSQPIPNLTAELFSEFARCGRRLGYEAVYFQRRKILRDCALGVWLGYDGAAQRLEKIIDAVCAESTWALPAHCAGYNDNTIDLFAAETAQTLTEIISLVYGKISEDVCEAAVSQVKKRVLLPYINRTEKYGWESSKSNWAAVCGGCIGMTALYLTEDNDETLRILSGLHEIFEHYMESFTDDGACLEGLYYWGYGMTYLTAFLDLYKTRMGEDFPVNREKLNNMALFGGKCCVTRGITASFSDSSERDRIYAGLDTYLSREYGCGKADEEYLAYFDGDECGRWCRAVRDIAWTQSGAGVTERISVLGEAQWAVIRGENYAFCFKGGHNGEPHNHNDVGSFMVVKDGEVMLCDLGAGEYTREYFSDGRYSILTAMSAGHSVPIIDGEYQMAGSEYRARDFFTKEDTISADVSGAYSTEKLKGLKRSISLSCAGVSVTDEFILSEPTLVKERFITRHEARTIQGGAEITAKSGAHLTLTADGAYDVTVTEYEHHEHDGRVSAVRAIDFEFKAKNGSKFHLNLE